MITIKSAREIDTMARAGRILHDTLRLMREIIRPGMTTEDLDAEAERFIRSHPGAMPSFKGLYGFPKTLCISIDEEIVHGIPSSRRVLSAGSIVVHSATQSLVRALRSTISCRSVTTHVSAGMT